jgi:hypothetical protein
MTAQISDTVFYKGEAYGLVGIHANGMFDPDAYNLKAVDSCCSACWRGVHCEYAIRNNEIRLATVRTLLGKSAKELFGVKPDYDDKNYGGIFTACYFNLHKKLSLTGGIVIARDFMEDIYLQMGFQSAWIYREVHELIFDNGEILQAHDRSKELAAFREDMRDASLKPMSTVKGKIQKCIGRCFSLHYKW